jgi:hypothetical protein
VWLISYKINIKKILKILNATGYPSIIQSTCLKSSMGLDKAGVPLSNIAY